MPGDAFDALLPQGAGGKLPTSTALICSSRSPTPSKSSRQSQ